MTRPLMFDGFFQSHGILRHLRCTSVRPVVKIDSCLKVGKGGSRVLLQSVSGVSVETVGVHLVFLVGRLVTELRSGCVRIRYCFTNNKFRSFKTPSCNMLSPMTLSRERLEIKT